MTMLLQKGLDYNATYASPDYEHLDANWTGSISFYTTYPGTATFTKALTIAADTHAFELSLTVGEIVNLAVGTYSVVSTMSNIPLGVEIGNLEYATVAPVHVSESTMCKIYGTIEKLDGTPAGRETRILANANGGTQIILGWQGVTVTVSMPVADADSGDVIGIETVSTTTNAAGYFEIYVIQGLTVTVSCSSFGKSVPVITTGETTIDISTYF